MLNYGIIPRGRDSQNKKKMYRINKIGNKFKFKNGIFFKTVHNYN